MAEQVRCLHAPWPLLCDWEKGDGRVHPDCFLAHYREAGKVLVDTQDPVLREEA